MDRRLIILGLLAAALAGALGWLMGRATGPDDATLPVADRVAQWAPRLEGRAVHSPAPPPSDAIPPTPAKGEHQTAHPKPEEHQRFVEGMVVDEAGRPVEGIPLVAAEPRKSNNTFEAPPDEPFSWSGPDGRFGGWVPVAERALGVGRVEGWRRPSHVWLSTVGGPVVFVLRKALVLRGTVLGVAGRPVEGAIVWAFVDDATVEEGLLDTDADGRFSIPVRADARRVRLVAMQPFPRTASGSPETEITVDVASFNEQEVVLRFEPGARIAGQVVGPDGEPLAGVDLTVQRLERRQRLFQGAASDAEGAFRIEDLLPGSYWLLVFRPAAGYAMADPIRVEAPTSGVRVALPRSHVLRGRIFGEDAGDFVVAWSWARTSGYPYPLVKVGKSKPDGSFEIDGVPDGDTELLVRRSGDDRCALLRRVDPAEEVLVRLGLGGAISGRVSLPANRRWQEVAVTLSGLGAWIVEPLSDGGSFRITGLPTGTYRLGYQVGSARGEFPQQGPVEPGATGLALVLPETL